MNNRKDDHIKLTQKFYKKNQLSDFDNVRFVYNSFAEMDVSDVDLSTKIGDLKMEYPFFINAMTGGSQQTKMINKQLATIAKATKLAMASGSLSAAIKDENLVDTFKVIRGVNPKGLIFANIGAEYTNKAATQAIDILKADALQIHLNLIQELLMPEGDRDFKNWLTNISDILKTVKIPIIVKETGFGMSRKTISELAKIGVKIVDISGFGGTNFAQIENQRRNHSKLNYLEDFGQSTVISLLEANPFTNKLDLIASGGIRNPLDIVKALALGAKAVGISALILNQLLENGLDSTVELINTWKKELAIIMTVLGAKKIEDLTQTDILLINDVKDWCLARKIDYTQFSNRQKYNVK